MNITEFRDQFDVLYNNITSNKAPGLNEYEKSLFLTKGQEEVIKNYFNPKSNSKQEGMDSTPKRQADFSTLIRNFHVEPASLDRIEQLEQFDKRSLLFEYDFEADILLILNEQITYNEGPPLTVIPISFQEYDRVMSKPYKYPPKHQVWKLITGKAEGGHPTIEMIGRFENKTNIAYRVRYIKMPKPLITENLRDAYDQTISIHGCWEKTKDTDIETPEELHEEILQRAVELAKAAWAGDINTTIQVGQRSE